MQGQVGTCTLTLHSENDCGTAIEANCFLQVAGELESVADCKLITMRAAKCGLMS